MSKFANLTPGPISLPSPNGGYRYFRSGEYAEESWFSRFVGPKLLTQVADDYTPSNRTKPPRPVVRVPNTGILPGDFVETTLIKFNGESVGPCQTSCQMGCQLTCELSCENTAQVVVITEHYQQIGSKYNCRYCDWSSESKTSLQLHLHAYHEDRVGDMEKPEPASAVVTGEPTESGESSPSASDPTTAVPRQAPAPSGADLDTENWYAKDGLLFCKTCQALGIEWRTPHMATMDSHIARYHTKKTVVKSTEDLETTCPLCKRQFASKKAVGVHKRFCGKKSKRVSK